MPPSPLHATAAVGSNTNNSTKQRNNNRSTKATVRKPKPIKNVNPYDIICSKASRTYEHHQGNVWYNSVIEKYTTKYGSCQTISEKNLLTKEVKKQLQVEHHESRFIEPLETISTDGIQQPEKQLYCRLWPPKRVHDKVQHALRTRWKKTNENSQQQQQPYNVDFESSKISSGTNKSHIDMRDVASVHRQQQPNSSYHQQSVSAWKTSKNVTTNNSNNKASIYYPDSDILGYTDDQFQKDFEYAMVPEDIVTQMDNQLPSIDNALLARELQQVVPTFDVELSLAADNQGSHSNPTTIGDNDQDYQQQQKQPSTVLHAYCLLQVASTFRAYPDINHVSPEPVRSSADRNIRRGNYHSNCHQSSTATIYQKYKKEEDSTKVAKSNKYYYNRRQQRKKQKQREYDLATSEERLETEHQQAVRRNYYYYCRRQTKKKGNEKFIFSL
jgi:hypothetical protein